MRRALCLALAWISGAACVSAQGPSAPPPAPLTPSAGLRGPLPEEPASAAASRRQILVRLPVPQELPNGTVQVEPNVAVSDAPLGMGRWPLDGLSPSGTDAEGLGDSLSAWPPGGGAIGESLPGAPEIASLPPGARTLQYSSEPGTSATAAPVFARAFCGVHAGRLCGLLGGQPHGSGDSGIGHERLVFAPFEIETTQPMNNYRFRFDAVHGFPWPDRSEYLWSRPGRGPAPDTGVSYQDFRFLMELGTPNFSTLTEIPLRILDPDGNTPDPAAPKVADHTSGLGDINFATKTVLLTGSEWQITQLFRASFPTGLAGRGLGAGHVALEPGLLVRYKWNDECYLHSELRYLFPVGADPGFAGGVLRYGLGYSYLLFESDLFAIVNTGELVDYRFLDGQKTVLPANVPAHVGGEDAFQFYPGFRFVFGHPCDLGQFEIGICGTFSFGASSIYDPLLRLDLRWSY